MTTSQIKKIVSLQKETKNLYENAFNNPAGEKLIAKWTYDVLYGPECVDNYYVNNFKRYIITQASLDKISFDVSAACDMAGVNLTPFAKLDKQVDERSLYWEAFNNSAGKELLARWKTSLMSSFVELPRGEKIARCLHPDPVRLLQKENFLKLILSEAYYG